LKRALRGFGWAALSLCLATLLLESGCGDRVAEEDRAKGRVGGPSPPTQVAERPNVVWICLDACRARNLGCYGYDRDTSPQIDRLARAGAVFEQHFAQSTWTERSVPSFLTGRYFAVSCLDGWFGGTPYLRIPPLGEKLISSVFQENGYHTAIFAAHAAFSPGSRLLRSFDTAVQVQRDGHAPSLAHIPTFGDINREMFGWLEQEPPRPFFVYIHAVDTHFPHHLAPPYDRWLDPQYDRSRLDVAAGGQHLLRPTGYEDQDKEYLRGLHDGSILFADTQIGRMLDKLAEKDLLENTLIVIHSDHGEALGEDGHTMSHAQAGSADQVIQTPMILSGPGVSPGVRVRQMTGNVDIAPTFVDLLDLKGDLDFDGVSTAPLLQNPGSGPVHKYAFVWHRSFVYDKPEAFALRTENYKYEFWLDGQREDLWAVPDDLRHRKNVIGERRDDAARLRRVMEDEIMPRWQAFKDLPCVGVDLKSTMIPEWVEPKEAIISVESDLSGRQALRCDNLWALEERILWTAPWDEDPPALHLSCPIGNGAYAISIDVLSSRDYQGKPCSAVRVKIEDDPSFQHLVRADGPAGEPAIETIRIGTYTVEDGALDIVFDDGGPDFWTQIVSLKALRTDSVAGERPTSEDKETLEALRENEMLLRNMGYL
jgi:arylsulfatase A-like enzyme